MRTHLVLASLTIVLLMWVAACRPVQAPTDQKSAAPDATSVPPTAPGTVATTWMNPIDGAIYVLVPAGPFSLGAAGDDYSVSSNEKPQTTLTLGDFWIMQSEVTNALYSQCVQAGACTEPGNQTWNDLQLSDRPVVNVSWQQAREYADWAGGRLPTEAEWEKACRGTDGRIYPWGNDPPSHDRAVFGSVVDAAAAVGSYPLGSSPYGAWDMAGNVWEWTSSAFYPYPYAGDDGREDESVSEDRVLRGGSFSLGSRRLRCDIRFQFDPNDGNDNFGFRVVSAGQ